MRKSAFALRLPWVLTLVLVVVRELNGSVPLWAVWVFAVTVCACMVAYVLMLRRER